MISAQSGEEGRSTVSKEKALLGEKLKTQKYTRRKQ
jgi:hypothetical protein